MKRIQQWRENRREGFMERVVLRSLGTLSAREGMPWVLTGWFFVLAVIAFYFNLGLIVGDIQEGSPILKESSTYNRDVTFMAKRLPGSMNPMLIIYEGEFDSVKEPEVIDIVDRFQARMAKIPEVTQTLSIANLIKGINMAFYENNPTYFILPKSRRAIYSNMHLLTSGGAEPGDYDTYYSYEFENLSIAVYARDHLPKTIERLLSTARDFIEKNKTEFGEFKVAGGRIGVIAALNESIPAFETFILTAALTLTGFFCMIFFRSFIAGILLVIPLALASWFTFGYMATQGIGVNLQTLPVSTIAIGIGVDYGIYLLSRIKEEHGNLGDLNKAIMEAVGTAGNAIVLTGIIIIAGVVFWIFSDIKFQADMGVLLSIVTLFHLLGTLILLPALVRLMKPGFIMRQVPRNQAA
jgi:predicted RND superfamily exporter protein